MTKREVDLRTDSLALPTEEMLEAMSSAQLGDDLFHEDPAINQLEMMSAALMHKEAGLFLPSGTMGNLVALLTHTSRGDEVVLEADSHIWRAEVGGISALAGLIPKRLIGENGALNPIELEAAINPPLEHLPRTGLVCIENTHNRAGGTVSTPERTRAIVEVAKRHGVPVHIDGARIFNAAVALDIEVGRLTDDADSVTFSISKGLSAPCGALLVGSQEFIDQARKMRRMVGGGMHMAGGLAAAGIVALQTMVGQLKRDHENASYLAEGLATIEGIKIDLKAIQTNIVLFSVSNGNASITTLFDKLTNEGIRTLLFDQTIIRMVTYRGIKRDDLDYVLQVVKDEMKG